jgi:putative pyruvate formate lyase activating enzyme
LEVIKLLDGIIDIYMPDVKYGESEAAKKYSQAPEYPYLIREVLKEMHHQVGDLRISDDGLAYQGLLIRHLVLPNNLAGSKKTIDYISHNISLDTYFNIMDQYHPTFNANQYPELNRTITLEEYDDVINLAKAAGMKRGFEQK